MANKNNIGILLVLMTGLIGFIIGLLGDFVKIAVTDLKNYNAVKVETETQMTDQKNIKLRYEIYKIGNKPVSFKFDFTINGNIKESGIKIVNRPVLKTISRSVLDHGGISFKDDKIEDGDFALKIKEMHKYDRFEVVVNLSAVNEIKDTDRLFRLNVKTEDPSIKALEPGFFDFLFAMPIYVTAIIIAIILLFVITIISHYTIGTLIK